MHVQSLHRLGSNASTTRSSSTGGIPDHTSPAAAGPASRKCRICGVYLASNLYQDHCTKNHEYCKPCDKPFADKGGLRSHLRAVKHPAAKDSQASALSSGPSLLTPGKPYYRPCRICSASAFPSKEAFQAHCTQKHHYCPPCDKPFGSKDALQTHTYKVHVCRCARCGRSFKTEAALNEHIAAVHQKSSSNIVRNATPAREGRFLCKSCQIEFEDAEELLEHRKTNRRHNWCFVCDKDFATQRALTDHLSSKAHKPLNQRCPLCSEAFSTPSAVAMHIESGTCHNIRRNQVTAAVHSLNVIPSISITPRITAPGCSVEPEPIASYVATEMAWDGTAFRCWLCQDKFKLLRDLNNHLNSPAHDKKQFKCPKAKCGRKVKLVSGLIQHIESGTCGLAKYKQVEAYAENLTAQFSRLLLC